MKTFNLFTIGLFIFAAFLFTDADSIAAIQRSGSEVISVRSLDEAPDTMCGTCGCTKDKPKPEEPKPEEPKPMGGDHKDCDKGDKPKPEPEEPKPEDPKPEDPKPLIHHEGPMPGEPLPEAMSDKDKDDRRREFDDDDDDLEDLLDFLFFARRFR